MFSASLNKTFPSFLPDDGEGGHELGAAQIISSVKQTLITINIDYFGLCLHSGTPSPLN